MDDLASIQLPIWSTTNKRYKIEKSIIHIQKPIIRADQPVLTTSPPPNANPLPPKKRYIKLNPVQDSNPNPEESIAFPSAENVTNDTEEGVVEAVPIVRNIGKRYICSTCNREFPSYYAFGGHKSYHKKVENRLRRISPLLAFVMYGQEEDMRRSHPLQQSKRQKQVINGNTECKWCNKTFAKRQGLAAHTRFCLRKEKEPENQNHVIRNFDLNELPPEAFLTT